MDTNLLFAFIDEIKVDHDAFVKTRIEAKPISRKKLLAIMKDLDVKLNNIIAHYILSLYAKNCDEILTEEFAKKLLPLPGFQAIVKNKKTFFDGIAEHEMGNVLAGIVSLGLDSDEKINNLAKALKKFSSSKNTKQNTKKPKDKLESSVLEIFKNHDVGTKFSRNDLAKILNIDPGNQYHLKKLLNALNSLIHREEIGCSGNRGGRRYFVEQKTA